MGQFVLVSSPIRGQRPDFRYCQTLAGFLIWGAFFDEKTSLSLTTAAGPRELSYSHVQVPP